MKSDPIPPSFAILIVDDEPTNIQLLGSLLKTHNYEIEFAMNGQQALEWTANKQFDLILLDIMMPAMDGYEVCKKLKSTPKSKHIPIIFLTAKTETEDIIKGFEVGGADYITKPFKPPELLARVKVQVEMKILRGLLPICANCKSIRDDKGAWKEIETYLETHSTALFTHSMCPACVDELYGEQAWYKKQKTS